MSSLIPRATSERLARLANGLRVVIVNGPRQSGKTTLLREHLRAHDGSYRSLDNRIELANAQIDPISYVAEGASPRIIDEVQRGGDDLVRAIKLAVDEDPTPGRFILAGSSRFLKIPTLSESLAGRAGFLEMWPLSMVERVGAPTIFINQCFVDLKTLAAKSSWTRQEYLDVIMAGGFPEALTIADPLVRSTWYDGYLSTVINRDISDFAQINNAAALPKILALYAARASSTVVHADIARSVELSWEAAKNYSAYLDMVFLTLTVPAWSNNLTSKITKTPKVYVSDSGLAAHLLQVDIDALSKIGHPVLGGLLETFVATELTKLITFADRRIGLWHLRDRSGAEIDFILEGPGGAIIGIEVKATVSPGADTAKHLRWLKNKLGDRFKGGIVFHLGPQAGSLGDDIYVMPLSTLWSHQKL